MLTEPRIEGPSPMPDDPISYRDADARFASKEALTELRTLIQSVRSDIVQSIDSLRRVVDTRHDDFEARLRIVEALAAKNEIRLQAVETPSMAATVGQSVLTSVISSLLTAAVAGGFLYYALSGHHV
jgi:hypothetical protein